MSTSVTPASRFRRCRRLLTLTTALGGLAVAMPVAGQSLPAPTLPGPGDATIPNGAGSATIGRSGNTLNVRLNAKNTIINWAGFNVPGNATADFSDGRNLGLGGSDRIAVLNRDVNTSGRISQLLGTITSDRNVAVWVLNPNGILVGGGAKISTGSLVLSTLDVSNADFLDGNTGYTLKGDPGSQSAITVETGAQIKVGVGSGALRDYANRGLVLVAPKIVASGTFDANASGHEQDVAFVTASDATLAYGDDDGPLSVTINAGTRVSGTSQFVGGTVKGRDVLFALASQSSVTDALLRVDANVTTATSGTRGIVLSAGKPATAIAGVAVAGATADDTGGIVDLTVNGDLETTDSNGNGTSGSDILAGASGKASFTGSLTSKRDVLLAGGGAALVSGGVTAGRRYGVSGTTVTLGKDNGDAVVQQADGAVDITAVDAITGRAGLTVQANAGGRDGPEALTLALLTPAAAGGVIDFAPGTKLLGGTNRQSAVRIRSATTLGSLSLGDVSAHDLQGAIGSGSFVNAIQSQGAVTTGTVSVIGALSLTGSSLTAGRLTSDDGAIALTTTGSDLSTGDLVADGAITLTSAGLLTTGKITSGADFTANAVGTATIGGDLVSQGGIALRAGSIRFNGTKATGRRTIDLAANVGGISAGSGFVLSSSSANTNDFIRLQAAGAGGIDLSTTGTITGGTNQALRVAVRTADGAAPLVLGDVTARALVGLGVLDGDPAVSAAPIVSSGSLTFGRLNLVDSFAASSTGGNLSVASIAVTGANRGISLAAALGTLTVQSTVSASGDVTLVGGTALTLDRVESRQGAASVTSGGALDLGTLVGATGATATATSIRIGTVTGGPVMLTAIGGGLTLGTVTGAGVTLNATGGGLNVANGISSSRGIDAAVTGDLSVAGLVDARGGSVSMTTSGGALMLLGGVSAVGAYTATGQTVTLGGQHKAAGAIAITATGGPIVGRAGSSILGDADGVGAEAIALSANDGAILLGNTSIASGGNAMSAVTVTASNGGINLGNVTAGSLTLAGTTVAPLSVTTGDLSLKQAFSATARNGVATGNVTVANGGVAIDGGTGLVQVGTINAARDVTLAGGSVNYGRITGAATSIAASTGNVVGGDITASGKLTVSALAGAATLGTLIANGSGSDVTLSSLGTLSATAVTAGGGAVLTTLGSDADILLADRLTAVDAVAVTAGRDIRARSLTSTAGTLTVSAPNGRLLGVDANGIGLSAAPGKLLSITVGNSVDLGEIMGGPITINAASITVGRINADQNAVTLAATNGDLRINGSVFAGDVSLTATGMTLLQSVSASGRLTLGGGTGLRFGDISGATITATSGGAITGTSANARQVLAMTGGSLSLGTVGAGTDLALIATAGDALLGTLSAGNDVTVSAARRAQVGGDVVAGGAYRVTGGDVVLGTQSATQRAGGLIAITSTSGDIAAAAGLYLTNGLANASGSPLLLDAAGAIALGGSRIETSALGLRAGDGKAVTLGTIDAGLIGGIDGQGVAGSFIHSGPVVTGDVTTRDIAIALSSGDLTMGTVTASGKVALSSASGALTARAITGTTIDLAAAQALSVGTITGSGALTASGGTIAVDAIRAAAISLRTPGALSGRNGATTALTATNGGINVTAGETALGVIAATGDVGLSSSAGLTAQSITGAGVTLAATNALTVGTIDATGTVAASGSSVVTDSVRGSVIGITTAGSLGGLGGGRTALMATGGDITLAAGAVRLASVNAAGGVAIKATTLDAAGTITAARQVALTTTGVLTTSDVTAGGDAMLTAGGAVTTGALTADGNVVVTGNGIIATAAKAGSALTLTSGGDIRLGQGQAVGAAMIDAKGLATLGALSAGPSLTIRAADAELTGIQRATSVMFQNNAAATSAMRIGDQTGSGGFRLSNAEVGLVQADTLRFDQGNGAMEVGALAFGADSGRRSVDLLTTGAVTVDGVVTGGGLGRTFRIGGGLTDGAASDIRVHATPTAGGRLLFGDANLDLRGMRIAVGLAPGFLDALAPGEAGRAQARAFIGDGNSALYNAGLGGGFYDPSATTIVSARSLNLAFTDYALFQNTGVPGRFSGVVLGGTPTMPVQPALTVRSNGVPGQASFAFFGTINGIGDAGASLLGSSVIDIDPALLATSRINGCLVGSGAGCLTTIVIQPVLQIFSWDSEDVFGVAADVSTPFAPIIGGNNEELLTGLPALSPEGGLPAASPAHSPTTAPLPVTAGADR